MTDTTYTIDAAGKKLGRIASDAASALAGKKSTAYVKNKIMGSSVLIKNAAKLDIIQRKRDDKVYQRYTYYPGGLKGDTMAELIERKGIEEVVRKAVYGMLPRNRLRPLMMKKLSIMK